MILGHHIFRSSFGDEVATSFAEKIGSFHELYISDLLLHEVGLKNNLNKNPKFNPKFYKYLMKYLFKSSPFIKIQHVSDLSLDISCSIYYLSEHEDIESFYMTQIVENWDGGLDACHQVWKLKEECNLLELNEHWF